MQLVRDLFLDLCEERQRPRELKQLRRQRILGRSAWRCSLLSWRDTVQLCRHLIGALCIKTNRPQSHTIVLDTPLQHTFHSHDL